MRDLVLAFGLVLRSLIDVMLILLVSSDTVSAPHGLRANKSAPHLARAGRWHWLQEHTAVEWLRCSSCGELVPAGRPHEACRRGHDELGD